MQAASKFSIPFDPTPEEQSSFYREVGAERRAREFAATVVLREFGANWLDVDTILEMFPPQSSSPRALNLWAEESLDRLARNARSPYMQGGR